MISAKLGSVSFGFMILDIIWDIYAIWDITMVSTMTTIVGIWFIYHIDSYSLSEGIW
jgi:hypothetical protein